MYSINRSAAIIFPKQPYIKWANSMPGDGREFTAASFKNDCTVILIPEYDTEKQARAFINKIWQDIFEEELWGWCTDETLWPKDRTQKMFSQWFSIKFHSEVIDLVKGQIEKTLV
jgi:hypothetical protein